MFGPSEPQRVRSGDRCGYGKGTCCFPAVMYVVVAYMYVVVAYMYPSRCKRDVGKILLRSGFEAFAPNSDAGNASWSSLPPEPSLRPTRTGQQGNGRCCWRN